MSEKESVADQLRIAAEIFEQRHKVYGDAYKTHGKIFEAAFPEGICLNSSHDFIRFGLMNAIFAKLNRYCVNYDKGGHRDSLHDMINFCAMLLEVDDE